MTKICANIGSTAALSMGDPPLAFQLHSPAYCVNFQFFANSACPCCPPEGANHHVPCTWAAEGFVKKIINGSSRGYDYRTVPDRSACLGSRVRGDNTFKGAVWLCKAGIKHASLTSMAKGHNGCWRFNPCARAHGLQTGNAAPACICIILGTPGYQALMCAVRAAGLF